ncbi:MAG: ATP-binding protein [Pirellulales bacterium]|nr:ATP-binding protein [Pirellulales bacterium]
MGQVISGVLINAGQAIAAIKDDSHHGKISLRSQTTDSDIFVTIEDNGCGIAPEAIDHIFEPFYSGRSEGEGRGLGLSIAYGIIQKHHGSISVSSEPDRGTKITIRLPLMTQPSTC